MPDPSYELGLYLHLARASRLRQRPMVRDRLLLVAGVIAAEMGLPAVAAYCRREIIEHNPGHLIRRWRTFAEAMKEEEFLSLFRQILRRYPTEKAERMLESLGIQMAGERAAYFSDQEYAAAILGTTPETLERLCDEEGSG